MNQKGIIKIMKIIFGILILAMASSALAAGKEPAQPVKAETVQILKIAPQDQRAVIKTPDGKMQIIKPGDVIDSRQHSAVSRQETAGRRQSAAGKSQAAELKVVEIAADRVVIEEKKGNETEKVIIRLVHGNQKIERIRKTAEQAPAMLAPAEKDKKANKQGSSFQ